MKIERLIIGGAALLVGLLLGWMVRGVATYNTHQASIATYDDWRVACPAAEATAENKDAHCELSTDVMDKTQTTPNAVARATITIDKDNKQLIGFVLPFGVALEAGMGLKIGKDPVKVYQYRTCNAIGVTSRCGGVQASARASRRGGAGRVRRHGRAAGAGVGRDDH